MAQQTSEEFAMVFWRSENVHGIGEDGYEYGETGQSDAVQREADRRYWKVAQWRRPLLRLLVAVSEGRVARIWPVDPEGEWSEDPSGSGKVAIPVGDHPLSADEARTRYPGLVAVEGDPWPARQGPSRAYVPLDSDQP